MRFYVNSADRGSFLGWIANSIRRDRMTARPKSDRATPERITLGVRTGTAASARPPVRMFLGSEPAQYRAERVFIWSVEQVRDPSRVYEIYLMKSVAGFRGVGWTTGFTNYRFAIPHFTRRTGRAIYNDVDQIYLADPAELFDMELGDHGILAVAANDLSVMVLDCARAPESWTLRAAQRGSKSRLVQQAARVRGLIGPLAPEWNLRDEELLSSRRAKILHYTTLHQQPWRPFPKRFVYQENPYAKAWHDLERSADAAGFELFTRGRPSALFEGKTTECLETIPDDDLPWILNERFGGSDSITVAVHSDAVRTEEWWAERFEHAAAGHPDVAWQLSVSASDAGKDRAGAMRFRGGGPRLSGDPPSVWVLVDDRPGNTTQSVGLARALGFPYEVKHLQCGLLSRLHNRLLGASIVGIDRKRSTVLHPPWPDLVIAAGRRTAPVARWIGVQSHGRARLVQLGRKGGDWADCFDLSVVPRYCRLFPHPRRIETSAPLHAVDEAPLREAAERWHGRFATASRPRIVLLVGGTSGQYRLDEATARQLGADVLRMARESGGSILATTSRRTGRTATEALCGALDDAAFVHRWSPDARENPHLGLLALADLFVITGDSESMLAEATSFGRPVYIYPLLVRKHFRLLHRFHEWVVARARSLPRGERGTVRPQQGLEYTCARLIERGFVRPTRDLGLFHEDLCRRGVARRFGESATPAMNSLSRDMEMVVKRVRALMGMPENKRTGAVQHASASARSDDQASACAS